MTAYEAGLFASWDSNPGVLDTKTKLFALAQPEAGDPQVTFSLC